jgi:hypothetical protein
MREILHIKRDAPECPYCGRAAVLLKSSDIYPHAQQDYGMFWACPGDCDAYVGTHSNSKKHIQLGRLANKELREWKQKAHAAFDPMWKNEHEDFEGFTRKEAYRWLTRMMGRTNQVHIGQCDVNECKQIVEIFNDRNADC